MVVIQNPNAFRNYEILEKFVAGIELKGFEVKAVLSGKGSLKGSYVSHWRNEFYLFNFYLPPYQEKNTPQNYDSQRKRKLLLKRKEINYLINKIKEKGKTIIPLKIFNKNNLIKIEIALVKGLKKFEKRDKIKRREFERLKRRLLKKEGVR